MIGYVNGKKIYLNENIPVFHGKPGEDLNKLTTTQIRIYTAGLGQVSNAPTQQGNWFNVEVLMQDANNGTMMLISDNTDIFLRTYQSNNWSSWRKVAMN